MILIHQARVFQGFISSTNIPRVFIREYIDTEKSCYCLNIALFSI